MLDQFMGPELQMNMMVYASILDTWMLGNSINLCMLGNSVIYGYWVTVPIQVFPVASLFKI